MTLPLSSLGTIATAPKRMAKEYIAEHGKQSEPLYIFVDFADVTKYAFFIAPAQSEEDFEQRYYSQIIS
jgi:hypothetical protein